MNFTVYKSSAGSGKTYTLVKEYLKLALSAETSTLYRNILAITFTNKAASEMKERVLGALKALASPKKLEGTFDYLLKDLITETKLPEELLRERAQKVLQSILHNYSDFNISTIDKFVHKIIRSFAYDLHIPLNFNVELDGNKLLKEAIDLVIAKVGTDEKLTRALVEFTESKADDEKHWDLEMDLFKFAKTLLVEDGIEHLKHLNELSINDFFEIQEQVNKILAEFKDKVSSIGKKGLEVIEGSGVTHDKFAGGANGLPKYFGYLANVFEDKLIPTPTIQKSINEDKWYAGKALESDKAAINSIKPQLLEFYDEGFDFVQTNLNKFLIFSLLKKNIYSIAVLNEIEKQVAHIKQENNILHISEFNKMIAEIVLKEPAPFIYERIGEKFKHYLIDEFQDTSELQWQNLLPLLENSLSEGNFNMIVGDGKQAIYRWRGGEVEQFSKLPEVYGQTLNPLVKQREEALIRNHSPKSLKNNFRSKAEIIDFNNKFFRFASQKLDPDYQVIYNELEQNFNPENTGGFVSLEFLHTPDDESKDFNEVNCDRILEIITDLQSKNYSLKDIAILVRRNADASIIAEHLAACGLDVVSSESLLISKSAKVKLVIAILSYALKSDNNIARAEILHYTCTNKGLSSSQFHELLTARDNKTFRTFLESNEIFIQPDELLKLNVFEACEEVIRKFNINQTADPYLQFFLDAALDFTSKGNNSLLSFMEWWDERKDKLSIIIPDGINAVKIMSIHKSKGLEFPVVIFPYANWDTTKSSKDNLWISMDQEGVPLLKSALVPVNKMLENTTYSNLYTEEKNKTLLDNLNVLYVALTRAEKQLYILSSLPSARKNLSKTFIDYIEANGSYDPTVSKFTFGELREATPSKEKSTKNFFTLNHFNGSGWRNKINISTKGIAVKNNSETFEQQYGTLMHEILSRITTVNDSEKAVKELLSVGMIIEAEGKQLQHKIDQLLQKEEIRQFFTSGLSVKNEREILLPGGEVIRPDRVILNNNSAIVVDYKTGTKRKNHHSQLQKYAEALKGMGYSTVEKYLIYIEEEKVEKVI